MRRLMSGRPVSLLAVIIAAALAATACSDSKGTASGGQTVNNAAPAGTANSLKGVCPDKVVYQDGWWPQAESAPIWRLLGENPTVDKGKKKATGRLVDNGVDTGVLIELRAGGPANNFTPTQTTLYTDNSVTMASATVDQAAQVSATKPIQSIFTPLDLSPLVLMWDPATFPQFNTISDIGQTDTKVLYFQGSTYMSYLTGTGILRPGQIDPSYDGSPTAFMAKKGAVVQQGFLTNEVYSYPNEIPEWKHKKIAYQLVSEAGYPNYSAAFAIRSDRKAELSACLKRLVPILQRSTVAYLADPVATNKLLSQLVTDFGGFQYSEARAANAVKVMKETGVMGNGTNKTIGDFEIARVQKLIDIVTPIFAGQKTPVKAGVKPEDLVTNEFIDQSIGQKSS
jgi:hypothetical protein